MVAQEDCFFPQRVTCGAVIGHGLGELVPTNAVVPVRQAEVAGCQHPHIRTHVCRRGERGHGWPVRHPVPRDAADLSGGLRLPAELVVLDGQSLDVGDGDVQMGSQITVLVAEPVGGLS